MVYGNVAIPLLSVLTEPIMVPLTLNCILAYCTGMSLCVSVSVAVKFTLSLLYPFIGFTVIVVGVIVTVRLVVLLVVAYVALPAYSASMV